MIQKMVKLSSKDFLLTVSNEENNVLEIAYRGCKSLECSNELNSINKSQQLNLLCLTEENNTIFTEIENVKQRHVLQ